MSVQIALHMVQGWAEDPMAMSRKIQHFLSVESKNLDDTSPFLLRLFKEGVIAKNSAGIRISESAQQFVNLNRFPAEQLSGLLF